MIEEVNTYYHPPSSEEIERFNIELYGEELYKKSLKQMNTKEFKKHRKLHGFNE
jgi:hypothetical protein